jgi:hypothetical protein
MDLSSLKRRKAKAGCNSLADVNANYMLLDSAISKPVVADKGGNRRFKRGGNVDSVTDFLSSFTSDKQGGAKRKPKGKGKGKGMRKGRYFGGNQTTTSPPVVNAPPPAVVNAPPPAVVNAPSAPAVVNAPPANLTQAAINSLGKLTGFSGGALRNKNKKRGGEPNNNEQLTGGGLRNKNKKRGGTTGVDLAPFAAAVALLANRVFFDPEFNKMNGSKTSVRSTKKTSKRSSKRRTI